MGAPSNAISPVDAEWFAAELEPNLKVPCMHGQFVTLAMMIACIALVVPNDAIGQSAVSSLASWSCKPGETTLVAVNGKDLSSDLRVQASDSRVQLQLEKVEPLQAILSVKVSSEVPHGPIGLFFSTKDGPQLPQVILVDDLPGLKNNQTNHSRTAALSMTVPCSADGTSDGPLSHFYQFEAQAGQRLSFEVITQALRSKMDPLMQLTDAAGKVLFTSDDDEIGPECRASHVFATDGNYWLEIRDSRFVKGGTYHLRIGDFPILSHAFPLAVQRGTSSTLQFYGLDGALVDPSEVRMPEETVQSLTIAVKKRGGSASTWLNVLAQDAVQVLESPVSTGEPNEQLIRQIPIGISGRLSEREQRDCHWIRGIKGQVVRFLSRTRSLGCATVLRMELYDSAHKKLIETKVADNDEWSFDFTFPEDGNYCLEVTDLLQRGGESFGYWIGIVPSGSFAIELKAVASTKESFAIETGQGIAQIDLTINRFGYEGEIQLSLPGEATDVNLINPRIPAKAKEWKLLMIGNTTWSAGSFHPLRLNASAATDPSIRSRIGSSELHRVLDPQILFPHHPISGGQWCKANLLR
ncbi:MAG: hypothetical protein ABL921_31920 [Pirellula sp.]